MTFKTKLDKVCEKCSDNSKRVYLINIRRLYRLYDEDGEIPATESKWLKSKKLVDAYNKLPYSKRRALSVAGTKASRAYGVSSDEWYKRLVNDQELYLKNRTKNKRTPEEDAKMLKGGIKELKKIATEYKRKINRDLKKPSIKSLRKYQLYISMRLFVELPFRNDFVSFLVSGKKDNYILYKKRKKAKFVVQKFKNSDKLGPREVEISVALTRALKQFLKFREPLVKHDFLFSNQDEKPMSKQAFSKAFHKVMEQESGKKFGSRILRIMHANENADIIEKSSELTNKMLHTSEQTKQYIKK